jgi:putative membrane protein
MQFLKTLFWIAIAVLLLYFGARNWHSVTLNLWGDIQADIKLPILLALMFLAGFLPAYFVLRARMWHLRRRLDSFERQQLAREPQPPVDEEVGAE